MSWTLFRSFSKLESQYCQPKIYSGLPKDILNSKNLKHIPTIPLRVLSLFWSDHTFPSFSQFHTGLWFYFILTFDSSSHYLLIPLLPVFKFIMILCLIFGFSCFLWTINGCLQSKDAILSKKTLQNAVLVWIQDFITT